MSFSNFSKNALWRVFMVTRLGRSVMETRETQTPIRVSMWFMQKVLGFNRTAYWPVHFTSIVTNPENIYAGVETSPGYMPGCYIQGVGKIYVGDYTQLSANIGIISANHDTTDNRKHTVVTTVTIGKYCWIGMNSMILPGVQLGDYTIVGAGSVVTKSFAEGYCIVAGNPARPIRKLEQNECVAHRSRYEYHGYIPKERFSAFRKAKLKV